jgi:hypothetical protein
MGEDVFVRGWLTKHEHNPVQDMDIGRTESKEELVVVTTVKILDEFTENRILVPMHGTGRYPSLLS